jgi:hypothetical protein
MMAAKIIALNVRVLKTAMLKAIIIYRIGSIQKQGSKNNMRH